MALTIAEQKEFDDLKQKVVFLEGQLKTSTYTREQRLSSGIEANPLNTVIEQTKGLMSFFSNANNEIGQMANRTIIEVRDAAMAASREMGGGLKYYESVSQEISKSQASIAGLGIGIQEIGGYQEKFTKAIGTNMALTADAFKDIAVLEKLGADGVQMSINFRNAAQSTTTMLEQLEVVGAEAAQYGVNTKTIFAAIEETMKTTDQYRFQNGVEGMSKMAAHAAVMGISFKSIVGFADKIMDPEGAIDAVANFQRLGVAVGDLADPFKLMYMAQSDMEGLTSAVAKSVADMALFNKETGKMEIPAATRMQMKEMGDQLGLSREEMNNLVTSQAKLAAMSEEFQGIKFDASEEDKLLIASLSEFNKDKKEFEVKVGGETKSVSELNSDDLAVLKERPKTLEDTALQQLSVTEAINASVDEIKKSFVAPAIATKAQLDLEKVARVVDVGSDAFSKAMDASKVKNAIDKFATDFVAVSMDALKLINEGKLDQAQGALTNLSVTSKDNFLGAANNFVVSITESMKEAPKNIKEKLGDKNIFNPVVNGLVEFVGAYVGEIQKKIISETDKIKAIEPPKEKEKSNTEIPVKDFVIKTLPEDTVKVIGGTSLNETSDITNVLNNQNTNTNSSTTLNEPRTEISNISTLNDNIQNLTSVLMNKTEIANNSSVYNKEMNSTLDISSSEINDLSKISNLTEKNISDIRSTTNVQNESTLNSNIQEQASGLSPKNNANYGDLADPFKLMGISQSEMKELTSNMIKSFDGMSALNKETGKMETPPAARMQMREAFNASILNTNNTTVPGVKPIENKEFKEIQTKEVITEGTASKEFNVKFDPIVIRLEGDGRNVELALDDNRIRNKIIDMVGDAMSYNYGGKSRL